jgi:hypothetical protein
MLSMLFPVYAETPASEEHLTSNPPTVRFAHPSMSCGALKRYLSDMAFNTLNCGEGKWRKEKSRPGVIRSCSLG